MVTTFSQLVVSGVLYRDYAINHWRRCSALIPDGLPERFQKIQRTAHAISLSSGLELSTGNGFTPTGIACPGGGKCRYRTTRSAVMMAMATLVGGGGQSMELLYHLLIRIHASRIRGGSDMRRDSTAEPISAALQHSSYWRLFLIVQMSALDFRWSLFRRAVILVLIRRQFSSNTHAWRRCYLQGGLGIPPPDIHKQAVNTVWGHRRLDGETLAFSNIS